MRIPFPWEFPFPCTPLTWSLQWGGWTRGKANLTAAVRQWNDVNNSSLMGTLTERRSHRRFGGGVIRTPPIVFRTARAIPTKPTKRYGWLHPPAWIITCTRITADVGLLYISLPYELKWLLSVCQKKQNASKCSDFPRLWCSQTSPYPFLYSYEYRQLWALTWTSSNADKVNRWRCSHRVAASKPAWWYCSVTDNIKLFHKSRVNLLQ